MRVPSALKNFGRIPPDPQAQPPKALSQAPKPNAKTEFPAYGSSDYQYDGKEKLEAIGISGALIVPVVTGALAGKTSSMRNADDSGEITLYVDKIHECCTHVAYVNLGNGVRKQIFIIDSNVASHGQNLKEFYEANKGLEDHFTHVSKLEDIAEKIKALNPKNIDIGLFNNLNLANKDKMHFISPVQIGFPMFMNANGTRDKSKDWDFGSEFKGDLEELHKLRFEQLQQESKKSKEKIDNQTPSDLNIRVAQPASGVAQDQAVPKNEAAVDGEINTPAVDADIAAQAGNGAAAQAGNGAVAQQDPAHHEAAAATPTVNGAVAQAGNGAVAQQDPAHHEAAAAAPTVVEPVEQDKHSAQNSDFAALSRRVPAAPIRTH